MKTRSLLVIASCLLLMVTSSLAADFISSLPLQGCQGVLVPLSTDKLMVQFNGTRMAFHALDAPNGSFDYASSLYFQWTDVRELLRGENGVKAETDTIVGLQELSDCVCNFAAINQVVDGILEEGVETTISSCKSNPTMVAKAFVTVSNETWWEPYGPTMDGSSLEYFNYTHPAKGIKFGFGISNWTWTTHPDYVLKTYIAGGFQFGFDTTKRLQVSQTVTPRAYIMDAQFGQTIFQMTMELGFLLNGIPTVIASDRVEFPIDIPGTNGFMGINWPMAFVQPLNRYGPLEQWSDIFYDPSLTVFFGDSGIVTPKQRRVWVVAVSVAIPLVVLLIVAAALIILFVPSVRRAVMPYRDARRKPANAGGRMPDSDGALLHGSSSSSLGEADSGWKAAAKPTQ